MKKTVQKAGILFLIFIIAIVVYFLGARSAMEKQTTVYTSMDEPTLPIVYTELNGIKINSLHGYMQDMGNQAARDSISVLPENRDLKVQIEEYGNTITGISYEIRNLSMERLIERTEVEEWSSGDDITTVTLPIQNLLTKNETYLMNIIVKTGEKKIFYYTRITWPDNTYAHDMVKLADEFTRKSMDYSQARSLTSYLETNNTEDNSSLGHVTIKASFNHFTWDGLPVEMQGEPHITLQEFDGIMGRVQVNYRVRISQEDGTETIVETEDNFSMKWNEKRIYMMNYERNANEIFTGEAKAYSGKRILLGISGDNRVHTMKSPQSRYLAFQINGDVWSFDQTDKEMVRVFTFDSSQDDGVRSNYKKHDAKIMRVGDDGTVDFLVYGYMNRGMYEGRTGVVYYRYMAQENTVQEQFFIPANESFDHIKEDVSRLAYLAPNDMMYLMLKGNVYGIELTSNEFIIIAQGLSEGSFAVSDDGSRFAWQEGSGIYESNKIHVIDFHTAVKQEIVGAVGDNVRVLGFVGNDLIYGLFNSNDKWVVNGRMKGMPMYAMYIVDNEMQVENEYKKDGIYITDVSARDGRIHLKCLVKLSENQYMYQDEDTIVCNQKTDLDPMKGIGWYASEDRGKVYFVQTDSEIRGAGVKISAPKAFSYEKTSILDMGSVQASQPDSGMIFYAYGGGHYIGSSRSFINAVQMAYDQMGYVTDNSQHIVWDRINRRTARTIKSPMDQARMVTKYLDSFTGSRQYDDGLIIIDAGGCNMNQVLYYIDKGIPVFAYTEPDRYVLLTGFDQYNITLYNPETQETWKMGLNDGGEYFKILQNDFICAVSVE